MHVDEQLLNDPNQSFEDPLTARLIYFVIGISIGAIALVTLFYEVLQKLKVEPDAGQNKGCSSSLCTSLTSSLSFNVLSNFQCRLTYMQVYIYIYMTEKDCSERTSRTG